MTLRHSLLLVTLAFGMGLGFTLWKQDAWPQFIAPTPAPPVEATTDEETQAKISTDAFSIKLLQAALQNSEGNLLLTPHAITHVLSTLRQVSGGETRKALEALPLHDESQIVAEKDGEISLVFADSNMAWVPDMQAEDIVAVPMGEQWADCIQLINNLMTNATGDDSMMMLNSDYISADTRLLSICSLFVRPQWALPLRASQEAKTDFYNANGSMPRIHTVQCSGKIRHAQAEDASWQAVALFLKLSPSSTDDTCLLLIQPGGNSARDFAQSLTAEQITAIRQALATAEPTELCIEFPRLLFSTPTQNLKPTLEALGLSPLFSEQADLSGLTTSKPCALYAALQKCRIPLMETETAPPDEAAQLIFNKPFIWAIGSLSSAAPPYALGVIENL